MREWFDSKKGQSLQNLTTARCVRCLKWATVFCGHVHGEQGETITAGWCASQAHVYQAGEIPSLICEGIWRPQYGLRARRGDGSFDQLQGVLDGKRFAVYPDDDDPVDLWPERRIRL
jgi:hypothetical protein